MVMYYIIIYIYIILLYTIGDKHGVGSKLREVWNTDKRRDLQEFQRDQTLNSELLTIKGFSHSKFYRNREKKQ